MAAAVEPRPLEPTPVPESMAATHHSLAHPIEELGQFTNLTRELCSPSRPSPWSVGVRSRNADIGGGINHAWELRISKNTHSNYNAELESNTKLNQGSVDYWVGGIGRLRHTNFHLLLQGSVTRKLTPEATLGLKAELNWLDDNSKRPINLIPTFTYRDSKLLGDVAWESVGQENILRFASSYTPNSHSGDTQ